MAPSRAKQDPTSVAGPSKERPRRNARNHIYSHKPRPTSEDALPGVQRLKSALRQTKRLLAKDRLAADVRVETERRLKALEVDLACAEQSRKEQHYATKYHKVKFFERQKVVRKIKQTKRSIENSEAKDEVVEKLESALAQLRVDLNYILHFPKTKRYVSLFPPEVRGSGSTAAPVAVGSDDNEERSKMREVIRQQMNRGELSAEPEHELGNLGQETKQWISGQRGTDVASSIKAASRTHADVASDDFFGDDDEEISQQSELSDS